MVLHCGKDSLKGLLGADSRVCEGVFAETLREILIDIQGITDHVYYKVYKLENTKDLQHFPPCYKVGSTL